MTTMIGNHTNFHTHLDNLIGFAQKMSPHSRTALIKEILTYYPLRSIFSKEPPPITPLISYADFYNPDQ
jgi:hypothetical protein